MWVRGECECGYLWILALFVECLLCVHIVGIFNNNKIVVSFFFLYFFFLFDVFVWLLHCSVGIFNCCCCARSSLFFCFFLAWLFNNSAETYIHFFSGIIQLSALVSCTKISPSRAPSSICCLIKLAAFRFIFFYGVC